MLKFIFLTEEFYEDYNEYKEIEKKQNRPYTMILATINNIDFAIPLRSNIKHNNSLLTDKVNKCGLDFSKAVVIKYKERYINTSTKPILRQNEFNELKGKEFIIKGKMESYITKYIKAYNRQDVERNKLLCMYSTLQYFHSDIGL